MRKSRFSETQIVEILQEGERDRAAGQGTAPVARHRSRTYSQCKAKYSGAPAGVKGRRCSAESQAGYRVGVSSVMATRRFWSRPVGLRFEATGRASPMASVWIRFRLMPLSIKKRPTSSARR